MAILEFDLQDVLKLCVHAMQAREHSRGYEDLADPSGEAHPGLILVGDQGVYLMSNGKPGLMKDDGDGHVVAYARGMNPDVDDFDTWWSAKRATFGGDDGADYLPWAKQIIEMNARRHMEKRPATKLLIELSTDTLGLVGLE